MSDATPDQTPQLPPGFTPVSPATLAQAQQRAKARLTVVSHVYHQPADSSPSDTPVQYSQAIESEEEPWRRWFNAREEWQPLQCGWVEQASLLILCNDEGKWLQRNPTAEERAAVEAKVVELGIGDDPGGPVIIEDTLPFAEVHPGRGCQFTPTAASRIYVRCRRGNARCVLTLIPK